jgi:hypothetical protein
MEVALRAAVRRRARECCEYCHLPELGHSLEVFHLEHIIAKQHGGGDELDNCAWCSRCNRRKGTNLVTIDEVSGQTVRLFNPRIDRWNEHFSLQKAHIVGLTPVGRSTVRLLDMNAYRRVELRRRLIRRGTFRIS